MIFVCRSIDICLDNEVERIHALRLSRKLMSVCPARFPLSLLNAIQAIASDGAHERDRMLRTSLATICELGEYIKRIISMCSFVKVSNLFLISIIV